MRVVLFVLLGLYSLIFAGLSLLVGLLVGGLISLSGVVGAVAVIAGTWNAGGDDERQRIVGGMLLVVGGVSGGGAAGQLAYLDGDMGLTTATNYLFGVVFFGGIAILAGLGFLISGIVRLRLDAA
jgi:hypothetical protein